MTRGPGIWFSAADRLEQLNLPDGGIAVYMYDPFGRRISKTVGGETTYFMYADEGLAAEMDVSGAVVKTYGWKPGSTWGTNPVLMTGGGNTYFYHNDHLGTPWKMTNATGSVVWSAAYTSFGEAAVDAASTVTNNLRFPGQYYDAETGLHYNFHRYYDPKTGRYVTEDPIGLEGGVNLYGYVGGNPVSFVDRYGLLGLLGLIWAGAEGGAEVGGAIGTLVEPVGGTAVGAAIGAVVGAAVAGAAIGWAWAQMEASGDDSEATSSSRTLPTPQHKGCGCTCICRADADDNVPGNIKPGLPLFRFGTATAKNCAEATKMAKRIATQLLGMKPKHIPCNCSGR